MIDYATWCAIRDGLAKHLGVRQVARDLGLNVKTVRRWRARPYAPRAAVPRPSKLDPFKGRIVGLARCPSAQRPAGLSAPVRGGL